MDAVDVLNGADAGESQVILRRVIWLCDACMESFAVDTWRPPGEQLRPSRRLHQQGGRAGAAQEGWN